MRLVDQLLGDARRLSTRLREHDSAADAILGSAQATLKDVEAMKQYQEELEQLNAIAHHRPRAQLVLGIQQENRHIRQLQHENKELRATLEEHQNAIELIMSKYRQQMNILVHSTKLDKNVINQKKAQLLQDKTDQIFEMASIMQNSLKLDEENEVQDQEIRTRLLTENRGLRELLEISRRNGSVTTSKSRPKYISQECQTEDNPTLALILSTQSQSGQELVSADKKSSINARLSSGVSKTQSKPPSSEVSPPSPNFFNGGSSNLLSNHNPNSNDSPNQVTGDQTNPTSSHHSSDEDLVSSDEEVIFNTIKRNPAKIRELVVDPNQMNHEAATSNGSGNTPFLRPFENEKTVDEEKSSICDNTVQSIRSLEAPKETKATMKRNQN
ncbi:hypothetical protein TCAL_10588 [Tigriopus californicus]|uniref:FGFR1 oncogene partner 2 homolog n=1 Tax=Tigriopus californicus TaxID=6832 RepID=A0A553P8I9_TIGCA|nr:FGFR1 oncogene partner 2 homolog isoform X2 [Tigriopus californicus]TRY74004.1 hypothetical protein TCAL_10588 [Tigriopus californicus]